MDTSSDSTNMNSSGDISLESLDSAYLVPIHDQAMLPLPDQPDTKLSLEPVRIRQQMSTSDKTKPVDQSAKEISKDTVASLPQDKRLTPALQVKQVLSRFGQVKSTKTTAKSEVMPTLSKQPTTTTTTSSDLDMPTLSPIRPCPSADVTSSQESHDHLYNFPDSDSSNDNTKHQRQFRFRFKRLPSKVKGQPGRLVFRSLSPPDGTTTPEPLLQSAHLSSSSSSEDEMSPKVPNNTPAKVK